MTRYDYPGSINIVSWKDNLPSYIEIVQGPAEDMLRAHIGNSLGQALDRYDNNQYFKIIADEVFEYNPRFEGDDPKEDFLKIFQSMSDRYFKVPADDVEAHL